MTIWNRSSSVFIAAVSASLGFTQIAHAIPLGYELIWNDEFDGTDLDLTKWNYRALGPRQSGVNTIDSVRVDGDGYLNITTTAVPDGKGGYTYNSGMIGTQGLFEHKYGYWEARMEMPDLPSKWSAFWLQSPLMGSNIGNPAIAGTEIDVVEYSTAFGNGSRNTIQSTLHWDGYGVNKKWAEKVSTLDGLDTGFHTYGVLWTPTDYTFYVDDVARWKTTSAVSGIAEYAILSTEVGPWGGALDPANTPDSLVVDYVRVYDPATLLEIPEPATATMLVAMAGLLGRRVRRKP